VEALPGCLDRAGQRRPDHDRVGAARERLGHVAAGAHATVGDDLDVAPGLLEVAQPGARRVGQGRRLRDADAEHAPGGAGRARADPDQDAGRAGPHQVQRRGVGGAAADDHRDVVAGDERLEVERLGGGRDVLGRDDRALDDQDVQARLERRLVVGADPLRGQRGGRDDAAGLDLGDALADQLGLHGRPVHVLHVLGRLGVGQPGDLVVDLLRVLVPGPEALEVQHGQAAELAHLDRRPGRHDPVHG
jgi:hypothetical protein